MRVRCFDYEVHALDCYTVSFSCVYCFSKFLELNSYLLL